MSVTYVPSTATLANIITTTPRTILLPPASERQGRVITVKDVTGLSGTNPITISTQGTNTFDAGNNLYTIATSYGAVTFVSRNNSWLRTATTAPDLITQFSTIQVSTLQVNTISSATISSIYGAISSQYIALSSLTGTTTFSNLVSTPFFNASLASTVANLGQAGYVSTQLVYIPGNALPFPPINIPLFFLQDYSTSLSTFSTAIGPAIQQGGTSISTFSSLIGPAISTGGSGIGGAQLISTVRGLGTVGYVSTQLIYLPAGGPNTIPFPAVNIPVYYIQDWSTPVSTVALFTSNTSNFLYTFTTDTSNYFSTYLSTLNPTNFTSTVEGLGTAGYISSAAFINLSNYFQGTVQDWSTPLVSTIDSLGTIGYLSSFAPANLYSDQAISSLSTGLDLLSLFGQNFSTFSSLQGAPNVASTVVGLGTIGYVSTLTLYDTISSFSTLLGPAISSGGSGITPLQSISTNVGLGSFGYVSTQLVLIENIGTAIAFPPINIPYAFLQNWSTPLSTFSTAIGPAIAAGTLAISTFSTLIGPAIQEGGTSISTFSSLIGPAISTGGSGIGGAQLISTVRGLGTVGYVSTSYVYYTDPPNAFAFPPINVPVAFMQDWSTPLTSLSNIVNSITDSVVNLTDSNLQTSNYIPASISSFSTSIAPLFIPRVPIIVSTITTNQTIQTTASGTYYFYTTFTDALYVSLPSASSAQSGWFISIQNMSNSTYPICVYTTPYAGMLADITPGSTIKVLTDGISFYFI